MLYISFKMTLLIVSLCVWITVTVATPDRTVLTDEYLTASPLIQSLLERLDILEKKGIEHQEEIRVLKTEMAQQRGEMREMRSKLNVKDNTIQSLLQALSKSDQHETSISEKSNQAGPNIVHSSHETGEPRQTRASSNRIRRAQNEVTIAFSAGLSQHMVNVGDNQNIKFDKVITNVGNAYNPTHGVFIAPVSGVYVLSTSILSYDSRNNWAYFVVNGAKKTQLFMHDDSHAMSSQTMVFDLNKGDDVAVEGHANDAYFGEAGLPYTTFTGFLLQQNYTEAGNIIG